MSVLIGVGGLAALMLAVETAVRVAVRGRGEEPNAYVRELRGATFGGDRYVDTLFPHPYLGWVHHGNPPSGVRDINNVGLFGQDFPCEKDDARFVILLTGGSVAAQLGQNLAGWPRYLEEELNRNWTTGDGRRFVVLNGGAGAWKQPQQTILFLLYCDVVDAVVTLDGWNEHYALDSGTRLEMPATNFHLTNPLATGSHRQVVGVWLSGVVERLTRRTRSRALGALGDAVRRTLYRALVERAPADRRRTTVESLFGLPPDYRPADCFRHAIRSYVKYFVAMNAIATQWQVKTAHFLQPAPAIGKTLTDEERAVVGDLGYKERYERMVEELLKLRRMGLPIVSLTDLFADCGETIYSDWSHLARDPDTGESRGYRMMAARMAAEMATAWGLSRREEPAACIDEEPTTRVACMASHAGGREETVAVALGGSARGGMRDGVELVHLLGTSAYRVLHANATAARGRGVPYVVTPFWEDWASWRVVSEALAQVQRVRLDLAPTIDVGAYAATVDAEISERHRFVGDVLRHARAVIATGASEAERLRREFPGVDVVCLPVPLPVRPPGDVDRFVATFGTRDFVLCVGRLEPRKNQLALLEALADDPVDVVLATGGIAHRPDYVEAIRTFRRRGRTLLLPHLDDALLIGAFRAARVHVAPSWEALPGVATLEALRAGCAVVATDAGTNRDVLADTIPYATPGDVAALRAAITAAAGWSYASATASLAELATGAPAAWDAMHRRAVQPSADQQRTAPAA